MALIAIASDKGAPGVTTAALALAAVWPRPVLLAECDPAGGDLVYRFPAAGGGHLDPRRGVLSLAVIARRGMAPHQVWEHAQKLHGGLDVLAGVTNAEQGAGLSLLWGPIGKVLASLPQADVIADCGRLGADGPLYDLLAEATTVVLVSRVHVADVIRLRDRATAFAAAAQSRGRRGFGVGVVVVADHKKLRASLGEVQQVLAQANAPATVLGGIAHDTKGADLLSGEWGGSLDRTLLIKTAREVAQHLAHGLPPIGSPPAASPGTSPPAASPPAASPPAASPPAASPPAAPSVAASSSPVPTASAFPASPFPASASAGPSSVPPAYAAPAPTAPAYAGPGSTAPSYARHGATETQPPVPSFIGPQQTPGASQVGGTAAGGPAGTPTAGTPAAGTPAAGTSGTPIPVARGGSPAGQRTVFSRVLGSRSGRHQADPGQGERTSGPAGGASFPSAAPGQAPDPAQAQASYVGAPVTPAQPATRPAATAPAATRPATPAQVTPAQAPSEQATPADPGRPPARHAQRPARPAANGPGYSRTPMSPLQPGDSGFQANGYQDQDFQDTRSQDHDFQDTRYQTSDSYASAPPDIRFPSDGAQVGPFAAAQAGSFAGSRPPEPVEAEPPGASADRPDSPEQDESDWGSSRWDASPGPMGSRRPGQG
jgi:MinD-like ATPase involved in chromosome partitioning or flagellar assembly